MNREKEEMVIKGKDNSQKCKSVAYLKLCIYFERFSWEYWAQTKKVSEEIYHKQLCGKLLRYSRFPSSLHQLGILTVPIGEISNVDSRVRVELSTDSTT